MLGATCLCSGHWGGGCLLPWIRPLHCAGLPSPHLLPLLLMAFLPAGVCAGPHLVPVGVPPPPNSSFLDRGTFVWELDGEQGAFEWLAEDWGHGEGQGQERGGSALATRRPPTPLRGWEEGRRSQARERVPGRVLEGRMGTGGFEVKALLEAVCWGQGERTPPHPHHHFSAGKDEGGARNTRPDTYVLYVGPSGKFSIPGPRLRQGLLPIPIKERPIPTKSGAQSGCGSVKAGGSERVRNREGEA